MWEALAAIGSILSAVVIAATVIFAARQVRLTVDQLEQVRKATQFEAARTVLLDLVDPSFVDAYRFIATDLEAKLADPTFRHELSLVGLADDRVHKELLVLRAFDRIGAYVRYGLVDGDIVYATYAPRIVLTHSRLADVMRIHREIAGQPMYRNFDYLYEDCCSWLKANGWTIDVPALDKRLAEIQSHFPAPAGSGTA